ncbi:MAG: DUF5723 family protein [candidate division Zixibacteria bacterium]
MTHAKYYFGGVKCAFWYPALALAILLIAMTTPLHAGQSSARSVGMSEAYIGLAKGVDAARYNPANLGLADYRSTVIELVGVGAEISNSAFSLNDYNKYTGATLTAGDKADILGKIPDEGLKVDARAEAAAMSASFGQFAFLVSGHGLADINLSKDIFELALNGNTFADTISVNGSYADAVSYLSFGLSYGYPVYNNGTRQMSIGVTAKYLKGLYAEQVVEMEGLAATMANGFEGEGSIIAQTAEGGSGYAIDVGVALRLNDTYTAGATLSNLIGSISWSKNPKEYGYIFSFDTMTAANMGDDYVVSDDYDIPISGFSTTMPKVLTVGIARTKGSLKYAFDWQQGLQKKPGASTKPRLATGVEWSPISFLPLRAGYGTGGGRPSGFSFGFGLHAAMLHLDMATVTGNSLSGNSAKGAHVALSLGIYL